MKRLLLFFFILQLLLVVSLAGCSQGGATLGEKTPEQEIPVEVSKVKRGNLEKYLELSGEVSADSNIIVVPKVNGTISTLEVSVGDQVKKGDLLVTLENKDLHAQMSQAEASFAQAQAALIATREASLPKRLEQLQNSVKQAEINYNAVKNTYERMEKLYQEGFLSQVEFENMEREYQLAGSQYQSAQKQLRLEKEGVAKELEALEAQVRQAEAGLAAARSAYEYTRIAAPIGGTVSLVLARQGDETAPGTPLLNIVDFSDAYVEAKVTERLLSALEEGEPVNIQIPATGAYYHGTIEEISLSPLPGTRTYLIKVYFEADEIVRLGQHARLLITTERAEDVLFIPRSAILKEEDKKFVYVIENSKPQKRQLKLGLETDDYSEVQEGLSEGEMLVIKGQHLLNDDLKVIVVGGETA